ncbi:MAG: alpha/beta fold hydrolase [Bacteroidetes bacterium]|nr:alpha/beta fold hydrolase [Bacteroidota bacterium]
MKIIKLLFILFLIFTISSCTFQKLYYYPNVKSTLISLDGFAVEDFFIPSKNGKKINCVFIKPQVKPIATILFLHGNSGNIEDWSQGYKIMVKKGFQIMTFDYQGFGKSEGAPSHQNLLDDAQSVLDYTKKREEVKNTKFVVLGCSIGGHLAVKLTNENQDKIDLMVIEGAFTTHKQVAGVNAPFLLRFASHFLVKSSYKATKNIGNIKIPKLIIHSTEDKTCPYWMGAKLFEKATEPKTFWEIKGRHVHGVIDYPEEYPNKIIELLKGITPKN